MTIGFFLSLKNDPTLYLHASALVRECRRLMPTCPVVQLSDTRTPPVPGVGEVQRLTPVESQAPLLDQRLSLYARCVGEWLLLDTDVQVRNSVAGVFDDALFDVALCDRNWPHLPQGEPMLQTMPFNTGVVFTRRELFWMQVLDTYRSFPEAVRADWLSEQQAVYAVVRSGRFRVKILSGMAYNYPPDRADAIPPIAALVHYKGPRKAWRSTVAYQELSR